MRKNANFEKSVVPQTLELFSEKRQTLAVFQRNKQENAWQVNNSYHLG
jgi:hypothetical protein